tara:strand:- start:175 stop:576 length:402 start_codon:yes stop_codon:yes gene_type:complete
VKEKDLNRIAKIEKAIAKKYGHEAIQNPKGNWDDQKEKDYLEQIKKVTEKEIRFRAQSEKIEVNGIRISRKILNRNIERTCPRCEVYSTKAKDDLYMAKFQCCHKCFVLHIEGRPEDPAWQVAVSGSVESDDN